MESVKRKLKFEKFCRVTTFHGLFYLTSRLKIAWAILIVISMILIISSTTYLVVSFLKYDSYIIQNEYEVDELEYLPNVLVCPFDKISLIDSMVSLRPKFSDRVKQVQINAYSIFSGNLSGFHMMRNFSDKFDLNLIQDLKKHFESKSLMSKFSCSVNLKNRELSCSQYISIVFTFNGPCWLINLQFLNSSLLEKHVYPLLRTKSYKIQLRLTASTKQEYSYFKFLDKNDNPYLTAKGTKLMKSFQKYYFEVANEHENYSTSLEKLKCLPKTENYLIGYDYYDEALCHFECLQLIIKELLGCHFTFSENSSMLCSVDDLILIEEAVKNYELLRKRLGICKNCLKNCHSNSYKIKQDLLKVGEDFSAKAIEWNFDFGYTKTHKYHILRVEFTQLLSFINGLWSLFFGISILSLWEIIEFGYALFSVKTNNSSSTRVLSKLNLKILQYFVHVLNNVYNLLEIAFNNTVLHGFKFVFDKYATRFLKLRWLFLMTAAFIGLCISVNSAFDDYFLYLTNIEHTTESLQTLQFIDRNTTVEICVAMRLKNVYENGYKKLMTYSGNLFKATNNNSLDEIARSYKNYVMQTFNGSGINDLDNTSTSPDLFARLLSFPIISLNDNSKIAIVRFNELCASFNSIIQLKSSKSIKFDLYCTFPNSSEKECGVKTVSILDSKSLHYSSGSMFKCDYCRDNLDVSGSLQYKTYLGAPYKPSCIRIKDGYSQKKCYQDCINENLIYKTFDCKVFYSTVEPNEKYCNPLLIPLIVSFQKNMLNDVYAKDLCKHCNLPCELFDYSLNIKLSASVISETYLQFTESVSISTQKPIQTLSNTIFIAISFFGLFFGGSLLALIQIVYNIMFNNKCATKLMSKMKNSKTRFDSLFKFTSSVTTLHCVDYISTNRNLCVRFFWLVLVIITVMLCLIFTISEIEDFRKSETISITREADLQSYRKAPKIDICREIFFSNIAFLYENFYGLDSTTSDGIIRALRIAEMSLQSVEKCYDAKCSIQLYLKNLYEKYNQNLNTTLIKNANVVINLKLNEKIFTALKYKNQIAAFDQIEKISKYTNVQSPINIYYYSLIYDINSDLQALACRTINWSDLPENISALERNPFIKLKNRILIKFDNWYSSLFYENYPLRSNLESYQHIESFKMFNLYDGCKGNEKKCIYQETSLHRYDEYVLFFCNEDFQSAFYEVFNCTPFFNNATSRYSECPLKFTALIEHIFAEFKGKFFNCRISKNLKPIVYSETSTEYSTWTNVYNWVIDFSSVTVYQQMEVAVYDSITLLINLSNFYNLLIGFSFISLIEIAYLLFTHHSCSKARISAS